MRAEIFRTCAETQEKLAKLESQNFENEPFSFNTLEQKQNDTEQSLINIHPEMTFNRFEGFGAAITEAAASTWIRMSDRETRGRFSCLLPFV